MCGHFIDFHTYQRFQAPKALWRCGSCGRQSYAPIDCCTRPNFASARSPGTARVCLRWLGDAGYRMMMRLRAIRWRRRPAIDVIMLPDDEHRVHQAPGLVTVEPVAGPQWTDAPADTEAVAKTTHVSV